MREHDAFEALAGAVALDEATHDERALYAAHAATCPLCRDDRFGESLERLRGACEGETWRPSLGDSFYARVREARAKRARRTMAGLGYALGLGIVLNVAFTSGFAGRLSDRLEASAQRAESVAAPRAASELRAPVRPLTTWHVRIARLKKAHVVALPHARKPFEEPVPDALAGLESGRAASGSVAVERTRPCDPPGVPELAQAPSCVRASFGPAR